jgi:hypothetical protein
VGPNTGHGRDTVELGSRRIDGPNQRPRSSIDALNQMIDKALAGIMNQRHRMKEIVDHDRFEYVQLEVALRASEADSRVVAMNLHRDHRLVSH